MLPMYCSYLAHTYMSPVTKVTHLCRRLTGPFDYANWHYDCDPVHPHVSHVTHVCRLQTARSRRWCVTSGAAAACARLRHDGVSHVSHITTHVTRVCRQQTGPSCRWCVTSGCRCSLPMIWHQPPSKGSLSTGTATKGEPQAVDVRSHVPFITTPGPMRQRCGGRRGRCSSTATQCQSTEDGV